MSEEQVIAEVAKNIRLQHPEWEKGERLVFEIEAGSCFLDASMQKTNDTEDFEITLMKPTKEYCYAALEKQSDGAIIPWVLRADGSGGIAVVYIIGGQKVNPGELAWACCVPGYTHEGYERYEEERNREYLKQNGWC